MSDRTPQIEVRQLTNYVANYSFWCQYVNLAAKAAEQIALRLAVFSEPFLSLFLDGRKAVESRFSRTRCAPSDQIREGDIRHIGSSSSCVPAVFLGY